MGYEGHGPLGKWKEGIVELVQLITQDAKDKIGLGYVRETNMETSEEIVERIFQLRDNYVTDSNEYEWDSLSEDSYEDKKIDVIHQYTPITKEGQSSRTRPFELGAQYIDDSSVDDSTSSEINTLDESAIIDLDIPTRICIDFMNQENNSVMNFMVIDPDDPLPLVYPELIDWDQTST